MCQLDYDPADLWVRFNGLGLMRLPVQPPSVASVVAA